MGLTLEKGFNTKWDWLHLLLAGCYGTASWWAEPSSNRSAHTGAVTGLLARVLREQQWDSQSRRGCPPPVHQAPSQEGHAALQCPLPAGTARRAPCRLPRSSQPHTVPCCAPQHVSTASPRPPREPRFSLICSQTRIRGLINSLILWSSLREAQEREGGRLAGQDTSCRSHRSTGLRFPELLSLPLINLSPDSPAWRD